MDIAQIKHGNKNLKQAKRLPLNNSGKASNGRQNFIVKPIRVSEDDQRDAAIGAAAYARFLENPISFSITEVERDLDLG